MTEGSLPSCKICSESFTKEENTTLSQILLEKFNISSIIKFKDNDINKPNIRFSTISSDKLLKTIKKNTHQELLYKTDEKAYLRKKS